MEIDYIRVYQDKSSMFIECDPQTHPTKQWIDGHIKWYTDAKNPMIRVDGGATCNSDNDCVARAMGYPSGRCVDRRCKCSTGYGGPRCTKYVGSKTLDTSSPNYFGPQLAYPVALTAFVIVAVVATSIRRENQLVANTHLKYKAVPEDVDADDGQRDEQAKAVSQRRFYAPSMVGALRQVDAISSGSKL
ncbi:unnamed protein product [Aphanomyces euteiches]